MPSLCRIYTCQGTPPQNPGGLGADPGWTCTFCVIDPPYHTKRKFAKLWPEMPSWASVWRPIYLVPYEGTKEADFTLYPL